jgi:hypothetical protein
MLPVHCYCCLAEAVAEAESASLSAGDAGFKNPARGFTLA